MTRVCSCERPVRSPNPRTPNLCLRCVGTIVAGPAPEDARACKRCLNPVDLHDAYAIGYHKSAEPMKWIYLCPGCQQDLRTWLGQVPL